MITAVNLALATVANPEEDTTAARERARLGLDAATKVLPSIADCLGAPIADKAARFWQCALIRHAVTIAREFSVQKPAPVQLATVVEDYEPYATTAAAQLQDPDPSRLWLVKHLWQRSGTGIIGGGAKGAKTWLALDLALSIASGTRALDTFDVHAPAASFTSAPRAVRATSSSAFVRFASTAA